MRSCYYCEKSYKSGGTRKLLRGHYNPTNFSKKRANLQLTLDSKIGKRVLTCTKCMRTKVKVRKPRVTRKPTAKKTA